MTKVNTVDLNTTMILRLITRTTAFTTIRFIKIIESVWKISIGLLCTANLFGTARSGDRICLKGFENPKLSRDSETPIIRYKAAKILSLPAKGDNGTKSNMIGVDETQ